MNMPDIGRGPSKPIPAEIQTVEGFLAKITDHHAAFYEENPDTPFRPILMVLCENGDMLPIMGQWETEEEKDMFCLQMQIAFKLWRVKSYVFAMEAWLSYASAAKINPDGTVNDEERPINQPDRKEVVFTIAIDKDGNKAQNCLEIIRDYQGKPHVVPFPGMDGTDFSGRFANLL